MGPIARARDFAENRQSKKGNSSPITPPPKWEPRTAPVRSSSPAPQQSIGQTFVRETGTTFLTQTAKNAPAEIAAVAKDKGLQTLGNEVNKGIKSDAINRLQGGSPTSLAEITKNAAVNTGKQIVREGVSNAAVKAAPKALEAGAKKTIGVRVNDADARAIKPNVFQQTQQEKEDSPPITSSQKLAVKTAEFRGSSTSPVAQQSIVNHAATTLVHTTETTLIPQIAKKAPAERAAVAKDTVLQTLGNEVNQKINSAAINRRQEGSSPSCADNTVAPKSTVLQPTPIETKKESTIYSSNSTKKSNEPQQLKNEADQEMLDILNRGYNQQTEWCALAKTYLKQKDWSLLNECINILKTLPKNEVYNNLLHDGKAGKSILHLIDKDIPITVLFNLFEHFDLEDTYIKKCARMDGLKAQMHAHVLTLYSNDTTKQIQLLEQCVQETTLGKFFRTSRRFFGYTQTNTIDSLQQEIKSLRLKQQQENTDSFTKKPNDSFSLQETFSIAEERSGQRQTPPRYSPTLFNQNDMPVPNKVSSLPAINNEHKKPLINKSTLLLALMISVGLTTLLLKLMPLNSSNHNSNEENNNHLKYF